jgi:hypothetical protein
MGPAMLKQLGEHVRVRPLRTLAVGWRDRLKDFDPSEPARKYPVGAAGKNDAHRRIPGLEQRSSGMRQKSCGDVRIGHPDTHVHLQGAEAEIEQGGRAILFTQSQCVRPQRGQHRASVHGTAGLRQAQGHTMAPALARGGLGCEQSHVIARLDPNAAARGHGGDTGITVRQRDRLIRVAHKLGNRPERAQAPVRFVIGHPGGKKLDLVRDVAHGTSPSDLIDGFQGNRNGTPSRSPRTTSTP